MPGTALRRSFIDLMSLWAGGWALSVAVWWPIQIVFHTGRMLGDGGLGGFFLLVTFVVWVGCAAVGTATYRETLNERQVHAVKFPAAQVIGWGAAAWIVERQALVAGNSVTTGVAFVASLLMPFTFIAAWLIVINRDRRGWLVLLGLAIALASLRLA